MRPPSVHNVRGICSSPEGSRDPKLSLPLGHPPQRQGVLVSMQLRHVAMVRPRAPVAGRTPEEDPSASVRLRGLRTVVTSVTADSPRQGLYRLHDAIYTPREPCCPDVQMPHDDGATVTLAGATVELGLEGPAIASENPLRRRASTEPLARRAVCSQAGTRMHSVQLGPGARGSIWLRPHSLRLTVRGWRSSLRPTRTAVTRLEYGGRKAGRLAGARLCSAGACLCGLPRHLPVVRLGCLILLLSTVSGVVVWHDQRSPSAGVRKQTGRRVTFGLDLAGPGTQ
ncbi:hypothetical protein C8Q77DRAFT_38428 [Trametes polyzona]|nr:hypothetical protein C8Q77DRAFT_38428 [Trametes polyzona]